ncbi:MAG: YfiR family protein [Opitutae bacterium]|nr:YfiR family protein [Opitutae bacterium]
MLLLGVSPLVAAPRDLDVKAVFLFRFAQFVEWPADAFPTPDAPIVIAVVGEDALAAALDRVVAGERLQGRPFEVRRYHRPDQVERCHVLYIAPSNAGDVAQVLVRLRGQPTLTVGDAPEFARTGGMIRFFSHQGRLRLEVNNTAARGAGLALSSKLLRIAEIVR